MGRIVLAAVVAGWGVLIAAPGLAQTNEACMLRCLDHLLYSACEARCTKPVPPGQAQPHRAAPPTSNVPAAASTSPAVAPAAPPASPQGAPLVSVPVPPVPAPAVELPPQPGAQPPARPAASQVPPQPAANQAPQQPSAQAAPQQSARPSVPPARPVNQACVLRCLDHGRLDQQCEAICAR